MTAGVRRLRLAIDRGLRAGLIRDTAYPVLVLRVLEGLAAWVLFIHADSRASFDSWPVHVIFIAYFLANGSLALRYREGRMHPGYLALDVCVNISTMTVAAVATGGIGSPIVLLAMMKIAGYGLLFSPRMALAAALVGALSTSWAWRFFFPRRPLTEVIHGAVADDWMQAAILALVVASGLWVFNRVAANERRIARAAADMEVKRRRIVREFESAKAAAERADEAYTETVALDGVSETLGGFIDPRDILNKVVEIARGILWWDYCLILIWDDQTQAYYCSEVLGFDPVDAEKLRGQRLLPADEPDLEWVRRLGHCAVVAPRDSGWLPRGEALTLLTAPLFSDGEFFGALQFARAGGQQSFTTNDLRLADRLVARTSTALRRARNLRDQQEAERLAAAGELAAGVAHEVNNALTGIQGQIRAVTDSQDATALRGALAKVDAQTQRIAAIIRDLSGFGQPQQPVREPVDLAELVDETLGLMELDLQRAQVRVERQFPRGLHPARADAKQLQQVLVNLFTNASHAMQPAGGTLRIFAQEGQHVLYLSVQDTGAGIAPDVLGRIFDPFFSTKSHGTGLGLSVSLNIVRAQGGDISVESALGRGTTFTIRLPVATGASKTRTPRAVLLVDDEPAVAASLEDMLVREGMNVQRAATGQEALDAVRQREFDAIFLDVKLPDIDGPTVFATMLRERPEMARRVVFVTGGLWRFDRRSFRDRLPPQPTLAKPCTSEQIREVLRLLQANPPAA